jgi:predicted nucleic acid-binding protein
LKLYADTSIFSYLFAEHLPQKQAVTRDFLQHAQREGDLFVSPLVVKELNATPDESLRQRLIRSLDEAGPTLLAHLEAVNHVSLLILDLGILTERSENDAIHIAYAIAHGMDALVSWDTRHIVRLKTRRGVSAVCRLLGYREVELVTPEEL